MAVMNIFIPLKKKSMHVTKNKSYLILSRKCKKDVKLGVAGLNLKRLRVLLITSNSFLRCLPENFSAEIPAFQPHNFHKSCREQLNEFINSWVFARCIYFVTFLKPMYSKIYWGIMEVMLLSGINFVSGKLKCLQDNIPSTIFVFIF